MNDFYSEVCSYCRKNDAIIEFSPGYTTSLWKSYCAECFHQHWSESPADFESKVIACLSSYKNQIDKLEERTRGLNEEKRAAEESLKDFLNHCVCDSSKRFLSDTATRRQIDYLKALAIKRKKNLDAEILEGFDSIGIENLTKIQATELIEEWK